MNLRPVASDSLVRRVPDPGYGPKRLPAATEHPKVENPLPLTLNLVAIEIAGLIALWSIANDLRSRKAATSKAWTVDFAHNRIGFCLLVAFKIAFIAFAAAMLLHALGLIGEPVAALKQALPFFGRR
jgi:hypothetical protein